MKVAIVGYARTSTFEQQAGLEAQVRDLEKLGCDKIFSEKVSSKSIRRPALDLALEFVREGDLFVVTKADRLARSLRDLLGIVDFLRAKGVFLRILNLDLDTSTPTGKLMLSMLGSFAEFERELMLERQREGIAKAKAEGRYKGRKPTALIQSDRLIELKCSGKKASEICDILNISRSSYFRISRMNAYK